MTPKKHPTVVKHMENPLNGEFTLCGDAFDIKSVDPLASTPVFAKVTEHVTCNRCLTVMYKCRRVLDDMAALAGAQAMHAVAQNQCAVEDARTGRRCKKVRGHFGAHVV